MVPLQKLMTKLARLAKQNLKQHGCLSPVLFFVTQDGVFIREDERFDADDIRRMVSETNALALIHLSEAWIVETKDTDDVAGGVGRHPDRTEAIVMTLAQVGDTTVRRWPIRRGEDDSVVGFGRVVSFSSSDGRVGGRLGSAFALSSLN